MEQIITFLLILPLEQTRMFCTHLEIDHNLKMLPSDISTRSTQYMRQFMQKLKEETDINLYKFCIVHKFQPKICMQYFYFIFLLQCQVIIQMIEILGQYILEHSGNKDAQNLIKQNELLNKRIKELEDKVERVEQNKLGNVQKGGRLQKMLALLSKSQQQLLEQKRALEQQEGQISNLTKYIQKYLSNTYEGNNLNEPRQMEQKLKYLNNLIQQAINKKYPALQISKMQEWNNKLLQNLQKKLCDIVVAFNTHIRINVQDIRTYKDMLNQSIYRQFVRILYKGIILYDVPTSSYILRVPEQQNRQQQTVTVKRETVIFTSEKSQKYYPSIQKCLQQTQKLVCFIYEALDQKQAKEREWIKEQISSCQQQIKAQVEYILPYLSLEKRKKIIEMLSVKSELSTTLYDILVRLRIIGQDGDMMESNIRQLVEKIKNSPELMPQVQIFLQICESENKYLNIGFYICDELINRLQKLIPYEDIEKLLTIREDIRFKIHHPL